ncbi:MAG: hypothetical protein FJ279_11120 [Planctomycetes bacterium]|nr:hypothetical protein [Planctomycetota bacterium]
MRRRYHAALTLVALMYAVAGSETALADMKCRPGPDHYASGHLCTAGPIEVGVIEGYDASTEKTLDSCGQAWEGHILLFKWSVPPKDIDHCCVDKVFVDKADGLKCRWELHKWDGARWRLHKSLGTSCSGAFWFTENEAITGYEVLAYVDDKANYAEDGPEQGSTFSLELCEPAVVGFQQVEGRSGTRDDPAAVGVLYFRYKWSSSCGEGGNHLAHLDDATIREYVDYQLSTGPTDFRLWPAGAWSQDPQKAYADKFASKGSATAGQLEDGHWPGPYLLQGDIRDQGFVRAQQYYQWAYRVPGPPEADETTGVEWVKLAGPLTILRGIYKDYWEFVDDQGHTLYRALLWLLEISKAGVENKVPVPLEQP